MDNSGAGPLLRTFRAMSSDVFVDSAALGRVQVTLDDTGALLSAPRAALKAADRAAMGQPAAELALRDFLAGWEHGFDLIDHFARSASAFLRQVDESFVSLDLALTAACRGEG